ncbi:unnamed protein product [Calypogeia fissa]
MQPWGKNFVSKLNPYAEEFVPAAKRMKLSHEGEGSSSSSHFRPSPDEPTFVNLFKPGSYFSSYKRVTSKREREEWRDHADIEPFRWHDPSSPCDCIDRWRRPPIMLGYSHSPPVMHDVVEEFSSDKECLTVEIDDGEDFRWSEDDSDDASDSGVWVRGGGRSGAPSVEPVRKINRSRVVTRLSKTWETRQEWMDPSLWKGLQEDLLLQIFAKLPFRSLSRLRTVCKSWNSVIYNRDFLDLCPRLPSEAPFCIIFDHLVQGYSIYSPASHTWYRLPRSFFSFSTKKTCLLASAGGLCLFEAFGQTERALYVVNPMNKTERRLPPMLGTGNTDEFVYVEMAIDRETDSFRVIAVESIIYPSNDTEDEDEDDTDNDEDNPSVNLHVIVSFQVYNSRRNSWETRLMEVDEKYKEILSTALYDGELYCLIRTLDNRYVVYLMGQEAEDQHKFERKVGDVIELSQFDHDMPFLHLFEQRGHLMICGKSRSAPGLGVRIWQLDAQRMKWKEVQRVPKKLRSKFVKLSWRSRVFVHGNYMWVSGVNKELVMANIANKSWCPVPRYTLGCAQDCSWSPSPKRRTSRYRCTLFLFEPRLDLVA